MAACKDRAIEELSDFYDGTVAVGTPCDVVLGGDGNALVDHQAEFRRQIQESERIRHDVCL